MDLSEISRLISSLRAQTAKDSISPNGLGAILQRIVDAISSMSGIDVEDETSILSRLSAAEADAQTALETAQGAASDAAGNVIDSFTHSQDEDEVLLNIKQHGHTAKQVVLPAASSTGAGIMTATDKSHLDTAYGKRINLMSAPSSESVVTLTITFGDGSTKSVTLVGATAGTGGKAGLMTKEQADQLAALVAAGTAESVRDDAGYLKQQYAAPVVLRNVTDDPIDDLSIGDIFYDTGKLWQFGSTESTDLGAPSKKVIYYCLSDQMLYRWTGSRFVQAVSISSSDIAVPTKLSDLINDMGFLTAHQSIKTINGQSIVGTGNITIDGAAELKDPSNHIKQSMATPVVLRNVTDAVPDVLNIGDVYYDTGILWCYASPDTHNLGAPSKTLIYYCLADNKFYRWTGSAFSEMTTTGTPGITPHIGQNGNWWIGPETDSNNDTGVKAQGPMGNTQLLDPTTFDPVTQIINDLTTGGEEDTLSAEMGKQLGIAVKNTLQIGSGVTYVELSGGAIGGTFVAPKIRNSSNFGDISGASNPRATTQGIIDNTSGTLPDTIELYIPVGYGFTGAITWCTVSNAAGDRAFTPWLTEGWQTIDCTQYNKTSGNGDRPYLAITLAKSSAFSDADLAVINGANGPKIRYSQAIDVAGGNKALSIVDENGDEMLGINSPSMPEASALQIYSKAAVDALLEEHEGGGGGSSSASPIIRVATWNFGHFCHGTGSSTAINNSNYAAKLKAWAKAINGLCATILCATEYDQVFEKHTENQQTVSQGTNDVLMSLYYAANSVGAKDGYNCNGIFSKLTVANGQTVNFVHGSTTYDRYYQKATVTIGGKTVTIVTTHLEMPGTAQGYQLAQLISDLSSLDYVIIAGDFNIERGNETKYNDFVNAGFKLANCGELGGICTWPSTGAIVVNTNAGTPYPYKCLDNIIVKGFDISNVHIYDDGDLTDHCAIMCDLTLL